MPRCIPLRYLGIRGILELHTGHSLPAQSQLLILKQCHCHQLALIRTWSTQFWNPRQKPAIKYPVQPDSLATLAGSAFGSTVILPFSAATYLPSMPRYSTVKTRSSCLTRIRHGGSVAPAQALYETSLVGVLFGPIKSFLMG